MLLQNIQTQKTNHDTPIYQQQLNRDDFSEQCWTILTRMLHGERITMLTAINSGIGDIRRRVKDLLDHHKIPVQREWALVNGIRQTYKWYYLTEEDIEKIHRRINLTSKI